MADILVHSADFSPFSFPMPQSIGEGRIAFADTGSQANWLTLADGARAEAPRNSRPIPTAWTSGLGGHEPPPSVSVEPWRDRLDPYLLRAQRVGDAVLVEQARGARDARSASWATAAGLRRFRDQMSRKVRIESLGDCALLLDPDEQRLEVLRPDREDTLVIPLPRPIAEEVSTMSGVAYRHLFAFPEEDAVVITAEGKRVFWFSASAIRALAPGATRWSFHPVWPRGDLTASVEGEVTYVGYGRTMVKIGNGVPEMFDGLNLVKGDKITLLGKVFDAASRVQFERLRLPNGIVISAPGAPRAPGDETTQAALLRIECKEANTGALAAIVKRLQALGFARGVDPAMIATFADGGVTDAEDLFEAYYRDGARGEARQIAEGYLTHDWRFGGETNDVIAELCARIGGEPLYTQVSIDDGVITVRDRNGREDTIDVEMLDDVVAFMNDALRRAKDTRLFHDIGRGDDQITYVLTTAANAEALAELGFGARGNDGD